KANPEVHIVRLERNLGFGAGANRGIAARRGDCFIIMNQDTVAHPALVSHLVSGLRSDPSVGACGPNLVHPWQPEFAGVGSRAASSALYYAELTPFGYVVYRRAPAGVCQIQTLFV